MDREAFRVGQLLERVVETLELLGPMCSIDGDCFVATDELKVRSFRCRGFFMSASTRRAAPVLGADETSDAVKPGSESGAIFYSIKHLERPREGLLHGVLGIGV